MSNEAVAALFHAAISMCVDASSLSCGNQIWWRDVAVKLQNACRHIHYLFCINVWCVYLLHAVRKWHVTTQTTKQNPIRAVRLFYLNRISSHIWMKPETDFKKIWFPVIFFFCCLLLHNMPKKLIRTDSLNEVYMAAIFPYRLVSERIVCQLWDLYI